MSFTGQLWALISELYSADEVNEIRNLETLDEQGLYKWESMCRFDMRLGGPGLHNIHRPGRWWPGAEGRYERGDRDIFRPLQYCAVHFEMRDPHRIPWLTRAIVQMVGLHLESLIKRMTSISNRPLGQLLVSRDLWLKRKLGTETYDRLKRFTPVYNAAKHDVKQKKDTHLFTPGESVLVFFVARRLSRAIYPHVRLATPARVWDLSASDSHFVSGWFETESGSQPPLPPSP